MKTYVPSFLKRAGIVALSIACLFHSQVISAADDKKTENDSFIETIIVIVTGN
jgi:hypothetical protein